MTSASDATPSPRRRLLLVFGGRSSEHEISVRSATEVLQAVDRDRFDVSTLLISRDGRFLQGVDGVSLHAISTEEAGSAEPVADLVGYLRGFDVVFPVLHGTWGEDGTIQGLFEVLGVPYVGSGVLASALCMDKAAFKTHVTSPRLNLPVAKGVSAEITDAATLEATARVIAEEVGVPCFVKPANQGSSVGVSKVEREDELRDALALAARYDPHVVVERAVDAREFEVAVLGNGGPETKASRPGEISLPEGTWYDYDVKYTKDVAVIHIPAKIDEALQAKLQELALETFRAVDCKGLARVDFLVDKRTGEAFVNEVNTLPGFTSISMYPKMMADAGVPYAELITTLCELAIEHHGRRSQVSVTR